MKTSELVSGKSYILTRDVTNPKPDRRKTRQFDALVTWPAGTRILFSGRGMSSVEAKGWYGCLMGHDPGFDELVAALVPAPRTLETIMYEAGENWAITRASDVLATLVKAGKLTLDDVEGAVAQYLSDEQSKYDAEQAEKAGREQ